MTVSTSRRAYKDCYDLFDRALAAPCDIRNRCTDPGQANHLRVRLHQARILLRRESLSIYAEEDPNHGASPYDSLIVRIGDQGPGLDPSKLPDPIAPENLLRGSGRGIFLIRSFMDEVHFRQLHPGTELTLIKHRAPATPAA